MNVDTELAHWADIAAIAAFIVTFAGACVGIYGYCSHQCSWRKKEKALVKYLKNRKEQSVDAQKGQQTATHLIRYVGLTEDEILRISFENKHIQRIVGQDEDGKANMLFFEYK